MPDVEAPANFSIVVPQGNGAGTTGLNMLYEGFTSLVRTRYPDRALRALFQHLGKYAPAESGDLLKVTALGLVRDDQAILVPRSVVTWLDQLAPRLNRAGWQFVDHPWSFLDTDSGELVVDRSHLEVDESPLADMISKRSSREPEPVGPGRFRLVGWGVFNRGDEPLSRAASAAAAAPFVVNPAEVGARQVIDRLLSLTERTPLTGLGSPFEGDFASRLISLAPRGDA